jgi:hypothetical protein
MEPCSILMTAIVILMEPLLPWGMNQMSRRIQPVDKRSNVTAKEVLLQAAAMMEQTPVMLATYR